MKEILMLIGLCTLLAMQSCSSDQDPTFIESGDQVLEVSHMIIKFEGKTYETDVVETTDSTIYLNEEYAEVYRSKISKISDVAVILSKDEYGNNCAEYFLNEKKLLEKLDFIQLNDTSIIMAETATRSKVIDMRPSNDYSVSLAVAELYDDRNFSDTKLISYATASWATAIPKLKDLGFNDKTSSIKVYNKMSPNTEYTITDGFNILGIHRGSGIRPVLKSYKDTGYKGAVLYCIAPPTGSNAIHSDYNLKNIGWNDKISAIAWLMVYDSSLFTGDNPVIPAHGGC